MERIAWNRLSKQWPIFFAVAVLVWFIASAIGVPDHVSHFSTEKTATTVPTPVNVSSGMRLEVQSFHIAKDSSSDEMVGKATIEAHNDSGNNATFIPGDLVLHRSNGAAEKPHELSTSTVQVASNSSVLTSVSFPIEPRSGGTYQLVYRDKTFFTGKPT